MKRNSQAIPIFQFWKELAKNNKNLLTYVFMCVTIWSSKGENMASINSFRIKPEVLDKLKKIAEKEKRSLNNLVNKILSDFTEKK